jgi:hypothetical protein
MVSGTLNNDTKYGLKPIATRVETRPPIPSARKRFFKVSFFCIVLKFKEIEDVKKKNGEFEKCQRNG